MQSDTITPYLLAHPALAVLIIVLLVGTIALMVMARLIGNLYRLVSAVIALICLVVFLAAGGFKVLKQLNETAASSIPKPTPLAQSSFIPLLLPTPLPQRTAIPLPQSSSTPMAKSSAGQADDISVTANLSETTAQVGEIVQFQIKVFGARSATSPTQINADGLAITYAGQSTQVQMNNSNVTMSVVDTYQVVPERAGQLTIHAQIVEVEGKKYATDSVTLEVAEKASMPMSQSSLASLTQGSPTPLPAPLPPSENEITATELRVFIEQNLRTLNQRDIEGLLSNLSQRVDYFDHGVVNQNFIRSDISKYFQRWPYGEESVISDISSQPGKQRNSVTASFKTHFRVRNVSGEFIEGNNDNSVTVHSEAYVFKIVSEKSRGRAPISIPERTTNHQQYTQPADSAEEASSPQQSSRPIYFPLGRFPDRITLVKIPDLKKLAGKSLNNVWLYGSFILVREEGNRALLLPYSHIPVIDAQSDELVARQYAQGTLFLGSTHVYVTFAVDLTSIPIGYPIHFSPSAPLEIRNVENRAGRDIVVEAVCHHAFSAGEQTNSTDPAVDTRLPGR